MHRKLVTTLILDLDNTLYDWLRIWFATFSVLRGEIVARMGDEAAADCAIRRVHQAHGTSEYRFLFEALFAGSGPTKAQLSAETEQAACPDGLYPGVLTSLREIRAHGTRIVGCTESMEQYSTERILRFGLDGMIDVLFCNRDHPDPESLLTPDKIRPCLSKTEVRHISQGRFKPDPDILREILKFVDAAPTQTAYVGDSIARDMTMARDAGIIGIHARYGDTFGREEIELLKRVSHWTDENVSREVGCANVSVNDSLALHSGFREIFKHLTFSAFGRRSGRGDEVGFER
jgi:phosphoglycolate phosphatase-like HAD superfamily hydrolase